MFSKIQLALMPLSFGLLFCLMLLYWIEAAFLSSTRSYTQYKKVSDFVFYLSLLSLTSLLTLRWFESGHFPLSNLYESLLFLSWSFLLSQLVLQLSSIQQIWLETEKGGSAEISPYVYGEEANLPNKSVSSLAALTPTTSPISDSQQMISSEEQDVFDLNKDRNPSTQEYEIVDLLGVLLSPLALISYSFAFLYLPKEMQKGTSLVPALQSNWLIMHVTVMILSYAALIGGSILSMALLLVNSLPKTQSLHSDSNQINFESDSVGNTTHKKTEFNPATGFFSSRTRLCEALDNYSYRMVGLGFPLLTVGILSGAVWANCTWGSYWSWDPKETWALITWLVFAIYLHARIIKGWGGEKAATIATAGFFVIWFCYLGVNLLGTGLHSYGWFSGALNK